MNEEHFSEKKAGLVFSLCLYSCVLRSVCVRIKQVLRNILIILIDPPHSLKDIKIYKI